MADNRWYYTGLHGTAHMMFMTVEYLLKQLVGYVHNCGDASAWACELAAIRHYVTRPHGLLQLLAAAVAASK